VRACKKMAAITAALDKDEAPGTSGSTVHCTLYGVYFIYITLKELTVLPS